jgi:small subunit ribosomal protein S4
LQEKQKLRFNYGLTERQLRKLFMEARRAKGNVGSTLIALLERRLDNVVFRAGFAPTIPAARQLVSHGHVRVNGRRVTIPSFRVRPGDVIRPAPASARLPIVAGTLTEPALQRPDWIAFDPVTLEARLAHTPPGDAAPFPVELQRVVEYYTKRT